MVVVVGCYVAVHIQNLLLFHRHSAALWLFVLNILIAVIFTDFSPFFEIKNVEKNKKKTLKRVIYLKKIKTFITPMNDTEAEHQLAMPKLHPRVSCVIGSQGGSRSHNIV